jgi:predicted  nucleic acid-binding Zn-ribbon protein
LCEQEERAKLAGEVERAEAERRNLEHELETCLKEIDTLRQQKEKEKLDHQVSECDFTPFQQNHLFSSPYS